MNQRSFIIFGGAELPWIYPLGVELSRLGPTTLIRLGASLPLIRRRPVWPFDDSTENLERLSWNYPPGFNGKLARIFTRAIRARLNRIILHHKNSLGELPFIITPYPTFLPYLEDLDASRLIYLNYDDLSVDLGPAGYTHMPEEGTIACRANTILCSSQYQTVQFCDRFKDKSHSIFHMPHGVNELFINPEPLCSPNLNTVCSIGYLSSRYDWKLIHDVIIRLPDVQFLFVGDIVTKGQGVEWLQWLNATLKLTNVLHITGLPHRETVKYFWRSSVNWMPYKADLRFVKASCPLKLMDGLASGRPIISADVPECRLYPDWVSIYNDCNEAVDMLRIALEKLGSPGAIALTLRQIEFARDNTWASRAAAIGSILERQSIESKGNHNSERCIYQDSF